MEDRLERLIGCLAGSGVGFGWPHAPQPHAESPASSRAAAMADGDEDTVQRLQSRLEEMERRLAGEAAGGDGEASARRHAARARPEGLHAGHPGEQRLPQEVGPAEAWGPRRVRAPPETLREGHASRPAANTLSHAAKADAQGRGLGSGGHAAGQHGERRARAAAETDSGGHAADARCSVEERDAMRWQARHRLSGRRTPR